MLESEIDSLLLDIRRLEAELATLRRDFAKAKTYHAAVLVQNRMRLRENLMNELRAQIRCAVNNDFAFDVENRDLTLSTNPTNQQLPT